MPLRATSPRHVTSGSESACEQTMRVRRGHVDWRIRKGWRDVLLGPGAPDWLALENDPRAVCVKRGNARATWRVVIGDRTVFAKVLSTASLFDRLTGTALGRVTLLPLRALFGVAASAEREWRRLREAEARGVGAVRSLAVGVGGGRLPQTVLLSAGVTDAVTFRSAWKEQVESAPAGFRRRPAGELIGAAARLFATAHECGFLHGDAHPDNILVRNSSTGRQEAMYVDVHSARLIHGPASPRRSLRSLAQFDQYFQRRATRAERLRFLRRYLALRPQMSESWACRSAMGKLLVELMRAKASHASRLARDRDRRLHRDGPYFLTLQLDHGWRARVVLRLERRHVFPESDLPDRTEADWGMILRPLVDSATKPGPGPMCFDHCGLRIERSRIRGVGRRLVATVAGSSHRRIFERCHKERHRDLPNELTLACLEHRRAGLVDATMLIRPKRIVVEPSGEKTPLESCGNG